MNDARSPKGENRDENGRFLRGHTIPGPGNPYAKRTAELRAAILNAVTPADVVDVIRALVKAAKGGDVAAAKVFLDRILGTPLAVDVLERIERLEEELTSCKT